MIGSWMKNHLVSDNKCNIVSLVMSFLKKKQGMANNVRLTFTIGDTTRAVYN